MCFSETHLLLPRNRCERVLQVHLVVRRRRRGQDHLGHPPTSAADGQTRARVTGVHPDGIGHDALRSLEVHHSSTFLQVKEAFNFMYGLQFF